MANTTKKKTVKKATAKLQKNVQKTAKKTTYVKAKNQASPNKKQTATTKKVARKSAANASTKSTLKPGSKKISVKKPAAAVAKPVVKAKANPAVKLQPAKAPVNATVNKPVAKPVAAPSTAGKKATFAVGEYVVYPTHGVGKILGHEVEKIGEYELKVFVISFEKDKMTLRVPVGRAEAAGLRSISADDQITRAIGTLKGRAKIARGMWSRRAQEYEAKINSGNLVQIAEVVRDLHKNVDLSERSYSERMIYETAMHRLCGEVAAFERVDIKLAQDRLLKVLRKQVADQAAAAAAA
jgi:CarD family transcriptional regulator